MSQRTQITQALANKLKTIDGTGSYTIDLQNQCYAKLRFWDEINDFPSVYISPGNEVREYLPAGFKWGLLNVSVKVYCKREDEPQEQLEELLTNIETCLDANNNLPFGNSQETTDILITSITTDEGLLAPYAVGEINLQIRYEVL